MTSAIGAITSALGTSGTSGLSALSSVASGLGTTGTTGTSSTSGSSFADVLTGQIDQLNATQANADSLAQAAATGSVQDAHDYMIASSEATLATDTVVTLKNQAVAAFSEIMRMSV